MKIYIPEKVLNKLNLSFNIIEGNLNIKAYNKKELESKVCPWCLLKTFKRDEIIRIKDIDILEGCLSDMETFSCMKLKLISDKNKKNHSLKKEYSN